MENFQDFMSAKGLDRLAEKCVRERIPVVEFVQWYEEEGQFLVEQDAPLQYQPSLLGNIGKGAMYGGGWGGAMGGLPGAGIGAGVGALAGGAKYLWDKWQQKGQNNVEVSKKQAIDALQRLAKLTPKWEKYVNTLIQHVNDIGTQPDMTAKTPPAGKPLGGFAKLTT